MDHMDDKFDAPLLGILQTCGALEPFLEVVLGFLYRKTDFFRPLSTDQSMGFPPGLAKEKLMTVFKKYERLSALTTLPKSPTATTQPLTPPATPGLPTNRGSAVAPNVNASHIIASTSAATSATTPPSQDVVMSGVKSEGEQIQGDWTTANWDHHNGGVTENYAWSQGAQDVELKLALPNPNIKASDLKIDIKPYSLKVQLKEESKPILDEKLHSSVKTEESVWSLHKGEYLQVNFEKGREGYWWTSMFEGGCEIKLGEIDTTRYMHEFGQEEKACVQKLMFDEHQKRQGLPTSDELATEDILKKAWNAEGSPFAGTPYDRSKINLSSDNTLKPAADIQLPDADSTSGT